MGCETHQRGEMGWERNRRTSPFPTRWQDRLKQRLLPYSLRVKAFGLIWYYTNNINGPFSWDRQGCDHGTKKKCKVYWRDSITWIMTWNIILTHLPLIKQAHWFSETFSALSWEGWDNLWSSFCKVQFVKVFPLTFRYFQFITSPQNRTFIGIITFYRVIFQLATISKNV